MADTALHSESAVSAPLWTDILDGTEDPGGSPASRKFPLDRVGGLTARGAMGFRLSTETGVPVSTTDRPSQGTLRLVPYSKALLPGVIGLYDLTRWKAFPSAEISLALTLTDAKIKDVFAFDNGGTLALELSADWTNDTTPADAIALRDGVPVKSANHTRRWVGTIRASGTNLVDDSAAKRFVWNAYNQVPRPLLKEEETNHVYDTATWRSWNNDAAQRVQWVQGEALHVRADCLATTKHSAGLPSLVGGGLDIANNFTFAAGNSNLQYCGIFSSMNRYVAAGFHFLQIVELGGGATATFNDAHLRAEVWG